MKQALFYIKKPGGMVQCTLCPRFCMIADGKTGFCSVRKKKKGRLVSLVYARPCSVNADPIEKKPLFHFAPGTSCLSICTVGCNLDCAFCQNWEISHPESIFGDNVPPERIVEIARENSLPGIAYTYTEPTIFYEYTLDCMKLAKKAGLYNVWVSNGYINPEPAKKVSRYLDAINVDLKGDIKFYQKLCAVPDEEPMKKALKIYRENNVWIEVTNLVIPGYNDMERQISGLVAWVRKALGPETPMHFSRFFPHYKMSHAMPTPPEKLEKAAGIAEKADMHYVYVGNMPNKRENTHCPKCGAVAIKRNGYNTELYVDKKGRCRQCSTRIALAGMKWTGD